MKITKYVHSCLLVEMPAPVNRTVLFDPGVASVEALDVARLEYLDNIVITHNHPDHMHIPLLKKLTAKFPQVRITTTEQAAADLIKEGISAITEESPGIEFFNSPHADTEPLFSGETEQIGVHYLGLLTVPGDNHDFDETKKVLAMPVAAPWGATRDAARTVLRLKPSYVVPIHDYAWSDKSRSQTYDQLEKLCGEQGITFLKLETGVPAVLDI